MALFSLFFACFAGTFGSILQPLTAADTTCQQFRISGRERCVREIRLKIDRELGEDQEGSQRIEY
jgi:hypothetical protein